MDTFVEQIIVRKKTGKDFAILAGILLGGCLLAAGSMIAFMMTGLSIIPMVAIVGICWGGYMLLGMRNIEYEYSFTNGDVTVDKIVNRRSRKRMVSFDCKDVEEMGPYNQSAAGHLESRAFDKRLFCGTADLAEQKIRPCAAGIHPQRGGTGRHPRFAALSGAAAGVRPPIRFFKRAGGKREPTARFLWKKGLRKGL